MVAPAADRSALAPPPSHTVSILPAAVVLILAVAMLFIFGFINFVDSPVTTATTQPIVLGGLANDPHTQVFAGFVGQGVPPGDIATSLIAPARTTAIGVVATGGGGVANYDREVRLSVDAPRSRLLGFYRSNLEARGWRLFSTGTASGGGAELLFQKAGTDGWYWESGVVAQPTRRGATVFIYRLLQASDFS